MLLLDAEKGNKIWVNVKDIVSIERSSDSSWNHVVVELSTGRKIISEKPDFETTIKIVSEYHNNEKEIERLRGQ